MTLFAVKLILALILLGSSIFKNGRSLLWRAHKFLIPVSAVLISVFVFSEIRHQFFIWYGNEFTKSFVPPFSPTGVNYFLFGWTVPRILSPHILLSLPAAYLLLFAAKRLNKKYGERFFYPEEPYLAASGILLTGYPGLLYYFVLVVAVYLLTNTVATLFYKGSVRVSAYYLWLPAAIIVIMLMQFYYSGLPWYWLLKI